MDIKENIRKVNEENMRLLINYYLLSHKSKCNIHNAFSTEAILFNNHLILKEYLFVEHPIF